MRLSDPQLPTAGVTGPVAKTFAVLVDYLKKVQTQVNSASENQISACTNAYTAPPVGTVQTYSQGDWVRNKAPVELGSAGSKYVITGWICVAGGSPGTWLQTRALTGN